MKPFAEVDARRKRPESKRATYSTESMRSAVPARGPFVAVCASTHE